MQALLVGVADIFGFLISCATARAHGTSRPQPRSCAEALATLNPTHPRHDGVALPLLPCLEVPPCTRAPAVATLDYIVGDYTGGGGGGSRRRDCYFADALFPSLLKHLLNIEGDAAE